MFGRPNFAAYCGLAEGVSRPVTILNYQKLYTESPTRRVKFITIRSMRETFET